MKESINILFLGDIVGRPGRFAVKYFLQDLENLINLKPDIVIANAENASHGFGLTEKNYNELLGYGIDLLTSGNHIWDRKDIFNYVDEADKLIRPYNYPEGTPGCGARLYEKDGIKIAVINLLGRVFMDAYESPWNISSEITKFQSETPIVLVDYHAEATAEKIAFSYFLANQGVSAMVGTHTHVQTADNKIIDDSMAYITDVGYCGSERSVIGMDIDSSVYRLSRLLPARFEIPEIDKAIVSGVIINIDTKSGISNSISKFTHTLDLVNLIEQEKLLTAEEGNQT